MRKIRYFATSIQLQKMWLNKMSKNGYKLNKVNKLSYEFVKCKPNEYVYDVNFVAQKSLAELEDYESFLSSMGYTSFFKNANLNWSFLKMRLRPYKDNPISTIGNYNKELLIVEKTNNGKPFDIYTLPSDILAHYSYQMKPWNSLLLLSILIPFLFINTDLVKALCVAVPFTAISIIQLLNLQIKIMKFKKNNQ